jgi:hypothetical protein
VKKWFIVSGVDDRAIIGPFKSKKSALIFAGWDEIEREGPLYKNKRRYLGKKSDFLRAGFRSCFESYSIEAPKPLESVPGWKW